MLYALSALERSLWLRSLGLLNFHCHVILYFISIFHLLRLSLSVFPQVENRRHLNDANGTGVMAWNGRAATQKVTRGCDKLYRLRSFPLPVRNFTMVCEVLTRCFRKSRHERVGGLVHL